MGVRAFNVMSLGKANMIDPEQLGYRDSIEVIQDELLKMERSFVKIGWHLKHIREKGSYKEDGYANIWECAEDQLGLSQSTASRFINICEKFSENGNSPELDERFVGFNKSQLIEMLPMSQEEIKQVTPDMSVSKIREFVKKNKKSTDDKISSEQNDSVPGQTCIEEDFKELLPDKYQDIAENDEKPGKENVYATSHKQDICNEDDSVVLTVSSGNTTIIEGEYRKIQTPEEESTATSQLDEGQQGNIQPELPMLKNNDQRKEWLANYKAWGLWYYDDHIDVNYYKYDFSDGSRLVVAEYPQRQCYWKKNKIEDEHFYHLLQINKQGYEFNYKEKFRNSTDAEGHIVDFLKNLQKSKDWRENK